MTRGRAALLGTVLGALVGAALLVAVIKLLPARHAAAPRAATAPPPAAGNTPAPEPGAGVTVKFFPVRVWHRGDDDEFVLRAADARIVWFDAPVERARQLARLALEGTGAEGVVASAAGIKLRDVLIDDRRTAWVDLDGASLAAVTGSDSEESLVAGTARTVNDGLDEVDRVGFLVDGRPRDTLDGHVDLARTFTGHEWPAIEPPPEPSADGSAEAATGDASADASAEAGGDATGDASATPEPEGQGSAR